MRLRSFGLASFAALALFFAHEGLASACGASPGGPVGHVMCGPDDAPLEHRFRGTVSYAYANTRMSFGDGLKFDMNRHLVMATLDYRLDKSSALTFGGGGLLAGNLRSGSNYILTSGPALMLGYSFGFLKETSSIPFGVLSVTGSFVHTQTRPEAGFFEQNSGYTALDARAGLVVGKTLFERLSVYATGRLFGGPAFWSLNNESKVGTDLYHYQVGGGLIVRGPAGLGIYGEGIALGERGVTAGLTLTP